MIKAWILTVFVVAYPGDDKPRLSMTHAYDDIRSCFLAEIDARAAARRMNLEVVTGCVRMYEGESL